MPEYGNITYDPVQEIPKTIANGSNVTEEIDLRGHLLVGVELPADFTSSTFTLEIRTENSTQWSPVYDKDGNIYTVSVSAATFVALPAGDVAALKRFRLKLSDAEAAERTVKLVSRQLGGW